MKDETPANRLVYARKRAGYETAVDAASAMGVAYPTYAAHENGVRGIGRAAAKYAKFFGVSLEWLLTGLDMKLAPKETLRSLGVVRKVGYVGAGQAVIPVDNGDYEWVYAPPDARDETTAVEVKGDSMFPVFEEGTLLYYSRMLPPAEMLNRRCVVHLADGRILVKTLRRGSVPSVFTLSSFNAPDMEDQVVEWASPIDWVKPR
jgi:hypothetical protein